MPHINSGATAASLSDTDLREQIGVVDRIVRGLEGDESGQEGDFLGLSMWTGFEYRLILHGMRLAHELIAIRHIAVAEGLTAYIAKIGIELEEAGDTDRTDPPWVGNLDVHRSHRSQLIRLDPQSYADRWPNTPPRMPALWPQLVDKASRGYRLRLSLSEARRLRAGARVLPEWLRYDTSAREVVDA
jgi:hypothetical protein